MTAPLFGVVGWKNSGKTTLMVKLIRVFTARDLTISAVKHAHQGFDVDHEGRDSCMDRSLLPLFGLDDVEPIADFILDRCKPCISNGNRRT